MNPVQLSHFVSLHDCSLALSTPVGFSSQPGSPSGSHHCISSLGYSSVSQSLGSGGSMPNVVIRLLELLQQVSELSQERIFFTRSMLSLFCTNTGKWHDSLVWLTFMWCTFNALVCALSQLALEQRGATPLVKGIRTLRNSYSLEEPPTSQPVNMTRTWAIGSCRVTAGGDINH